MTTSDKLEIPVPPNNRYFLGEQHPQAKSIIVRFATVHDRKPTAGSRDEETKTWTAEKVGDRIVVSNRSIAERLTSGGAEAMDVDGDANSNAVPTEDLRSRLNRSRSNATNRAVHKVSLKIKELSVNLNSWDIFTRVFLLIRKIVMGYLYFIVLRGRCELNKRGSI